MKMQEFQLRYAAGMYWLLDMRQTGLDYKKPLAMNACGAFIWKRMQEGSTQEQVVAELMENYHIDKMEAQKDVESFCKHLKQHKIIE